MIEQAHAVVDALAKVSELADAAIILGGVVLASVRFTVDGSRTNWSDAYQRYLMKITVNKIGNAAATASSCSRAGGRGRCGAGDDSRAEQLTGKRALTVSGSALLT